MKINFKNSLISVAVVAAVGVIGYLAFVKPAAAPTSSSVVYTNNGYGFSVTLPLDWQGYTVSTDSWTGSKNDSVLGDVTYTTGPLILIQNTKWTKEVPYQDIPIMVFTMSQWQELSQEVFHIGASPIGPSELGRNQSYVFALPARYNYAYPPGWEEVEQILASKPLKAF